MHNAFDALRMARFVTAPTGDRMNVESHMLPDLQTLPYIVQLQTEDAPFCAADGYIIGLGVGIQIAHFYRRESTPNTRKVFGGVERAKPINQRYECLYGIQRVST